MIFIALKGTTQNTPFLYEQDSQYFEFYEILQLSGCKKEKNPQIPNIRHKLRSVVEEVCVMVWGCIAALGVGNSDFIETIKDQLGYLNI